MPEVVQDASWNRINQIGNLGNGISRAVDLYNMFKPGGTEDQRRAMFAIQQQKAEQAKLANTANIGLTNAQAGAVAHQNALVDQTAGLTEQQKLAAKQANIEEQFKFGNNATKSQFQGALSGGYNPNSQALNTAPLPDQQSPLAPIGNDATQPTGKPSNPDVSSAAPTDTQSQTYPTPPEGFTPDVSSAAPTDTQSQTSTDDATNAIPTPPDGFTSDTQSQTSTDDATAVPKAHKPVVLPTDSTTSTSSQPVVQEANTSTPPDGATPLPGTNQAYNVTAPTGIAPVNVQQPSRVKPFIPNQPPPTTITFKGRTMPNPANPSIISNPNYIAPHLNKFGVPEYRNANQTNQFISNPNYLPTVTPQQTPATAVPNQQSPAPAQGTATPPLSQPNPGLLSVGGTQQTQQPQPQPQAQRFPPLSQVPQAPNAPVYGAVPYSQLPPQTQQAILAHLRETQQQSPYWHPGQTLANEADAAQAYNEVWGAKHFDPLHQMPTAESLSNNYPGVVPSSTLDPSGAQNIIKQADANAAARDKIIQQSQSQENGGLPNGKEFYVDPYTGKRTIVDMPPSLIKGMDGLPKEASDKVTTIRSDFVKSPSYPEFSTATGALNAIDSEVNQMQTSGRTSQKAAVILSSISKLDNPNGVLKLSIIDLMKQDPSLVGKITIEAGKLIGKGELNMDQIKEIQQAAHTYYASDKTTFGNAYKDALIAAQEATGGKVPMDRLARMVSGVVGAQSIIPDQTNLNQSQENQNYPMAIGKDGTKIINKDGQWYNAKTGQPFKG